MHTCILTESIHAGVHICYPTPRRLFIATGTQLAGRTIKRLRTTPQGSRERERDSEKEVSSKLTGREGIIKEEMILDVLSIWQNNPDTH